MIAPCSRSRFRCVLVVTLLLGPTGGVADIDCAAAQDGNGAAGSGDAASSNGTDTPQADATAAPASSRPGHRNLLTVARSEASRERAILAGQVTKLLEECRSSADPGLAFLEQRINQLAAIGTAATPQLLAAMNHSDPSAGAVNAGINASRAIALIEGQPVTDALLAMTADGHKHGRLNAVRALGSRGDRSALEPLKALLESKEQQLVAESLRSIGRLGGVDAATILTGFVSSDQAGLAVASLQGLTGMSPVGQSQTDAVQARLHEELAEAEPNEPIIQGALSYFTRHPAPNAIADLKAALAAADATPQRRLQAIGALLATGKAHDPAGREVLAILKSSTKGGLRSVVRAAALAMLELGDDSGVDAVTADLDVEISRNPKNYNARYKRGEVFLEFRKWWKAANDLRDGLKLEKDPRDPDRVYLGLARAYAGLGRFGDSAKYLNKLPSKLLEGIVTRYPEFGEMASDSRFGRYFPE